MSEHDSPLPETLGAVAPVTIIAHTLTESSIDLIWGYNNGYKSKTRLKWLIGNLPIGQVDVAIGLMKHTINGLKPDTVYRIRAFGLEGNEESSGSAITEAATKPATSKPPSPANLLAVPSKNSMALSWSGVANASSYKIDYGIAPSGPATRTISVDPAFTVVGLTSNTNYYFDVTSTNNNGDSAPTRIVKQTLQVPAPPTNLRATPAVTTLDLAWNASVGAINYHIRYGVEPGGAPATAVTKDLSHQLTGLSKNTLYFVEVSAANTNGDSTPARITQKTQDGPPLPTKPGPLHIVVEFDKVRVAWPVTIREESYEVTYGLEVKYPEVIGRQTTQHLTDLIIYLAPDTRYFIEVRAFNASGHSAPSRSSATIGPDMTQPRGLRIPGRTFSEARLAWDRPVDYSYLTGYEISCPGRETVQTTELEYIATNLVTEKQYLFKVQPTRGAGPVPALPASISVTTHDQSPPTRPQGLKLTRTTPGNATLSWNASEDNVGVTGYEVSRNEQAWVATNATSHPVSGLIEGVVDTFRVRAKDAADNASRPSSVRSSKQSSTKLEGAPTSILYENDPAAILIENPRIIGSL